MTQLYVTVGAAGVTGPLQLTVPEKFHVVVVFGGNWTPGCGAAVTVMAQVLPSPAGRGDDGDRVVDGGGVGRADDRDDVVDAVVRHGRRRRGGDGALGGGGTLDHERASGADLADIVDTKLPTG